MHFSCNGARTAPVGAAQGRPAWLCVPVTEPFEGHSRGQRPGDEDGPRWHLAVRLVVDDAAARDLDLPGEVSLVELRVLAGLAYPVAYCPLRDGPGWPFLFKYGHVTNLEHVTANGQGRIKGLP